MPKNDFFSPKAIANRIKAKGLQKLRWYCQMCEKQCRDENGFKCHVMSEGHQRQMKLFSQNSRSMIEKFSSEFKSTFLKILSSRHGTKRVSANQVYQELIQDRHHLHMNATRWQSLAEFVKYLGREGLCKVDDTEKGWFISWIDTSPAAMARQEAILKMDRSKRDQEQRDRMLIAEQIERGRMKDTHMGKDLEALERDPEEKITIQFQAQKQKGKDPSGASSSSAAAMLHRKRNLDDDDDDGVDWMDTASSVVGERKKTTALDEILYKDILKKQRMEPTAMEERRRSPRHASNRHGSPRRSPEPSISFSTSASVTAAFSRQPTPPPPPMDDEEEDEEPWVCPGIIVKNQNNLIAGGKYADRKALITRVQDEFIAELRMLESGDVIRVDQVQLETVIPAVGGLVMILRGPYKGHRARLKAIDVDRYQATVELLGESGKEVSGLEYEWISKCEG